MNFSAFLMTLSLSYFFIFKVVVVAKHSAFLWTSGNSPYLSTTYVVYQAVGERASALYPLSGQVFKKQGACG